MPCARIPSLSEGMRHRVIHFDSFDFILTPDSSTISNGAPLCLALSVGRYFGYQYTDRIASVERQNAGVGSVANQFPHKFFTSLAQRNDGTFIADYEALHGITFLDACSLTLDKNARYILITNDADTTFQARNLEWCGDASVQDPEVCDDGNNVNTDTCTNSCEFAACLDGFFQPLGADGLPVTMDDEECDDGNSVMGDGCTVSCRLEYCGDEAVQSLLGEQCDDGLDCVGGTWTGKCVTQLTTANCVDNGGQCLPISGDGCTDMCQAEIYCGDSMISPLGADGIDQVPNGTSDDEECDDGNGINIDQCTNVCHIAICGDAITAPLGADGIDQVPDGTSDDEECDDGNTNNEDFCDNQCRFSPMLPD